MESIWSEEIAFKKYPQLEKDITVDTVVIGAGLAGILIAYKLMKKGMDTVIIEADTVCSGQTKNTTAKITSQHGVIYSKIASAYGERAAAQYASANEAAIDEYEKIIKSNGIECDFERKQAVLYTLSDSKTIKEEAEAAVKAGISCFVTDQTELPFDVVSALVFENQAQFNPLAFVKGIIKDLKIYEHTRAIKLEDNRVYTDGGTITANNIVFACHYPFVNFPGMYFFRMSQNRSYVVSVQWKGTLNGMYIADDGALSLRTYKDQLLIGGDAHRTGLAKERSPYKKLMLSADSLYSNITKKAEWSAQDCITLDGIPYIGRFSNAAPNVYVATGFNKWGMTSSMVSANIISDMICKKDCSKYAVFSPSRFSFSASIGNICENFKETFMGFAKAFQLSPVKEEDIKPGNAAVIKYNGKNAGAYRDDDGKIYIVSLRCPHLKCILQWNDAERTWDCPCHGSRYSYKGELIDNPAQQQSILLN